MAAKSLKLSALFLAAALAGCVEQPAARSTYSYTYKDQKYADAASALAAQQRDLGERVAAVPIAPTPLAARAVIVVPDRDRLRPLMRTVLTAAKIVPTDMQLDFAVDLERQIVRASADSVVRSRLFQTASVVVSNDTVTPTVDNYDYLLVFQVKPATATATGAWIGRWVLQKRGAAVQFNPIGDPGVAPIKIMASFVDSVRQGTLKLEAMRGGAPATVNAAGAGAAARASGTGIIVAKDGVVITNAHVVQQCTAVRVMSGGGTALPATVKAQDRQNDLALLKVQQHWPVAAPFRDGAGIRQGDGIVVVGYPLSGVLASDINLTTGSVSALAGLGNDTRLLQITAPVQPGNSGGPLLDMGGHLVGVVSAKLNALAVAGITGDIPQNINFAIKSAIVRNFLDANAVGYTTSPTKQALSAADVGVGARKFTVLVECLR